MRLGRLIGAQLGGALGFLTGGIAGGILGTIAGGSAGHGHDEARRNKRQAKASLQATQKDLHIQTQQVATERANMDTRVKAEKERLYKGIAKANQARFRGGRFLSESSSPIAPVGVLG